MKTQEQIEKRITMIKSQIASCEANRDEVLKKVSQRLIENAENPRYVSEGINSWMSQVAGYDEEIKTWKIRQEAMEWLLD